MQTSHLRVRLDLESHEDNLSAVVDWSVEIEDGLTIHYIPQMPFGINAKAILRINHLLRRLFTHPSERVCFVAKDRSRVLVAGRDGYKLALNWTSPRTGTTIHSRAYPDQVLNMILEAF